MKLLGRGECVIRVTSQTVQKSTRNNTGMSTAVRNGVEFAIDSSDKNLCLALASGNLPQFLITTEFTRGWPPSDRTSHAANDCIRRAVQLSSRRPPSPRHSAHRSRSTLLQQQKFGSTRRMQSQRMQSEPRCILHECWSRSKAYILKRRFV
jgi:hypothetical protein